MKLAEITDPLFDKFLADMGVKREDLLTDEKGLLIPVECYDTDRDAMQAILLDVVELGMKGKIKRTRVDFLGDGEHEEDVWKWLEANDAVGDFLVPKPDGDYWLLVNE